MRVRGLATDSTSSPLIPAQAFIAWPKRLAQMGPVGALRRSTAHASHLAAPLADQAGGPPSCCQSMDDPLGLFLHPQAPKRTRKLVALHRMKGLLQGVVVSLPIGPMSLYIFSEDDYQILTSSLGVMLLASWKISPRLGNVCPILLWGLAQLGILCYTTF